MDEKKQIYEQLHAKLAEEYGTEPRVISMLRSYQAHGLDRAGVVSTLEDYITLPRRYWHKGVRKPMRATKVRRKSKELSTLTLGFVSGITDEDFAYLTKYYKEY